MTKYHKELVLLSVHFCIEYIEKKDSDINELLAIISKHRDKFKNQDEITNILELGYEKLNSLTNGKDIDANPYILFVGFASLLLEDNFFIGSSSMATKRLIKSIYGKVESTQKLNEGFKNANKLVTKYQEISQ